MNELLLMWNKNIKRIRGSMSIKCFFFYRVLINLVKITTHNTGKHKISKYSVVSEVVMHHVIYGFMMARVTFWECPYLTIYQPRRKIEGKCKDNFIVRKIKSIYCLIFCSRWKWLIYNFQLLKVFMLTKKSWCICLNIYV